MKKLILILACTIAVAANAQTKIAEISEPGRWLVYETGKTVQIDSLEKAIDLLTKAGEENCSAWILEVTKGTMCSVWITESGVQFRQSIVKYSESDSRKKIKIHGSNK